MVGGQKTLPRSISQGLQSLGVDFDENRFSKDTTYKTCFVVKDVDCLRWAIELKRQGLIKNLVAGPMIVNFPHEADRIIESPLINTFILPSVWIKNLFAKLIQSDRPNLSVWALGVDTDYWRPRESVANVKIKKIIVYAKNPTSEILSGVQETLKNRQIEYDILVPGLFTREEYRQALINACGVIFLSRSETQGLAMFEAWSCDVPTLHWNPGVLMLMNQVHEGASSCPYLNSECGLEFTDGSQFESQLQIFIERLPSFTPREFVLKNYKLSSSIERLLEFGKPLSR